MTTINKLALVCIALLIAAAAWYATLSPSHDRVWAFDQAVMPSATITGDTAEIRGVRDFVYTSATSATPAYYDHTYDLSGISRTWYIVAPFGPKGVAHAFFSFEFDDGEYVSISVEARKEEGEAYSPLKGIFPVYELMYVVGSERDIIGTRANHRGQDVYVYPLTLTREQSRVVFESMLHEVTNLAATPQFYNTFTGSCMTGVAKHLAEAGVDIPLSYEFILPAYSDRLFYTMGLIDTELSFDKAREQAHINGRATSEMESHEFSRLIRVDI